jgi:hypothetical protein
MLAYAVLVHIHCKERAMKKMPAIDPQPKPIHIFSRVVIPYDIDFFGEEGCQGTDWWPDWYGTTVRLLVMESGSAYVCPEKPHEGWRMFMAPSGEAEFLAGSWPAVPDGNDLRGKGYETMQRVLECGIRSRFEPATMWLHSRLWRPARSDAPAQKTARRGPKGEWRRWSIETEGSSALFSSRGRAWIADDRGVFWLRENSACDLEHPHYCIPSAVRMPTSDIPSLLAFLETSWNASNAKDRSIIESAAVILERSWDRMREVEAFERACSRP